MAKKYDHGLIRVPINFPYEALEIISKGREVLSREFRRELATSLLTKLQGRHLEALTGSLMTDPAIKLDSGGVYPNNTPYEWVANLLYNVGAKEAEYQKIIDNFEYCIIVYTPHVNDHFRDNITHRGPNSIYRSIESISFLAGVFLSCKNSLDLFGEWDIPDTSFLEAETNRLHSEFTSNIRHSYIPPYDPEKAKRFLQDHPGRPDYR